jgi:hypothetical protein
VKRRFLLFVAVLSLVAVPAITWAAVKHGSPGSRVTVTPPTGSPRTAFVVMFRTPDTTGRKRSTQRHDEVIAQAPGSANGCLSTAEVIAPDAKAGTRVRATLDPAKSGGRWCTGTYRGEIDEIQSPICPKGVLCPAYAIILRKFGHFTLHVSSPGDHSPPRFAGLKSAFACTPGPQRPGQTTPVTLTWNAATDDQTPSSGIVYDIFMTSTSGAEDYRRPTWTTSPGVTSYRTPGVPSHGTFYFVVRARDRAGNEDGNTVERRLLDPCL